MDNMEIKEIKIDETDGHKIMVLFIGDRYLTFCIDNLDIDGLIVELSNAQETLKDLLNI